jgi:hypothetical protein
MTKSEPLAKVSKVRRRAVTIVAAVIVLLCCVPPWHSEGGGYTRDMGYGLIISPPQHGSLTANQIDLLRLLVECLVVLVIGGAYVYDAENR